MNPDGRSCATCAKAELVGSDLAGVTLECRALPPVQDIAKFARWPTVRPEGFCHTHFEPRPIEADEERP